MPENRASQFIMQEITGPPNERNTITLRKRALPFRPYTLRGTQRGEVSWYPGNPIGSVQILGPTEEPTTISGVWHDNFIINSRFALLNDEPLADSRQIVIAVDDMRRQGKLLQVQWDEEIRQGYISSFERSWDRREDVAWSIEFTWISQGDIELPPVTAPVVSISDLSQRVNEILNNIDDEVNELAFATDTSTANMITTNLTQIKAKQTQIQNIVSATVSNAISPLESARRTAAALQGMADDALQFTRDLESKVLFNLRSIRDPIQFTAGVVLTIQQNIRATIDRLKQLRNMSLVQKTLLLTGTDGGVLQELIGDGDDDLRRIAQSQFGRSADWRLIALFNNVRTSRVVAGQRIQIPRPNRTG